MRTQGALARTWACLALAASAALAGCHRHGEKYTDLRVSPSSTTLASGTSQSLTAEAQRAEGEWVDVSDRVVWSVTSGDAVMIDGPWTEAVRIGNATIAAQLPGQGLTGECIVRVSDAAPAEIQVTPPFPQAASGTELQLVATAIMTDGTVRDLTDELEWTTTHAGRVSVDRGHVRAIAPGAARVRARHVPTSMEAVVDFEATPAALTSIDITCDDSALALGRTVRFAATGAFTDDTVQDLTDQVVWQSSDPAVVAFLPGTSASTVTALGIGTATLEAIHPPTGTRGTFETSTSGAVLAEIGITAPAGSLPLGTRWGLRATGVYSDATTSDLTETIAWSSRDTRVASVTNDPGTRGTVTGEGIGMTDILAARPDAGVLAGLGIEVSSAMLLSIELTPSAFEVPIGQTREVRATGIYSDGTSLDVTDQVTWSSSEPGRISVSNAEGSMGTTAAKNVGEVTLEAAFAGTGVTGTTTAEGTAAVLVDLWVEPIHATAAAGTSQDFRAFGLYSDTNIIELTGYATWSSSSPHVAAAGNTAGNRGVATAATTGSTSITATDPNSGLSAVGTLTVTPATLDTITVTPPTVSLAAGGTANLSATGLYSDGTVQDLTESVAWLSADEAVGTVSNAAGSIGVAQSVGVGATSITATHAASGVAGSASLEVTAATLSLLELVPDAIEIAHGTTAQVEATGTFSDGTVRDLTEEVTWSCTDSAVATVSNLALQGGDVSALGVGEAELRATHVESGLQAAATVTVTPAALSSLVLSSASAAIPAGTSVMFTATGWFTDGSSQDLTEYVTWSSDAGFVATISNASGNSGDTIALAVGSTTVTATDPATGIEASVPFEVTAATLLSIAITLEAPALSLGGHLDCIATGHYSDGSTLDVTSDVTWLSSLPLILTVSNDAATKGRAFGLLLGLASITALHPATGISTSVSIDVVF